MKKIILVGKPNSGKSLLFNRLTGLDQRVANFPGVTVFLKKAKWRNFELMDFPGSYSLKPITEDEVVAVREFELLLKDDSLSAVVCVLDSTQLMRSLHYALQVLKASRQHGKKVIFAFNMYDEIISHHLQIDFVGLQRELGIACTPLSAKTGYGVEAFSQLLLAPENLPQHQELPPDVQASKELNGKDLHSMNLSGKDAHSMTSSGKDSHSMTSNAKDLSRKYGPQTDLFFKKINRLDRFFLSSLWGGPIFLLLMALLFQSIFTWSTPLMDFTESFVATVGDFVSGFFSAGIYRDFVVGAIFGGLGTFIVFAPQIFILTFVLGILEDSGYLARIAIICHRPLQLFGLSGKSFIPFLSGHACAIPAIYSARMIESPKKRLITMLTVPLISCSARLPVYSLLVIAFIPDEYFLGWISLRGMVFFGLFLLGYVTVFIVSSILNLTIRRKEQDVPFIVELPSYRRPFIKPLFLRSLRSAWEFLSNAGPVIFFTTAIVWVLGYFPQGGGNLEGSWLYMLGRWFEPAMAPLGLDWKFGVAVLTSFIAREVFVGTLGTFYGIESADGDVQGLSQRLQQDQLTTASGLALLIFYVIALQCVSTLAVIRRETNSLKIPVLLFVGYTALAYVLALITYKILT